MSQWPCHANLFTKQLLVTFSMPVLSIFSSLGSWLCWLRTISSNINWSKKMGFKRVGIWEGNTRMPEFPVFVKMSNKLSQQKTTHKSKCLIKSKGNYATHQKPFKINEVVITKNNKEERWEGTWSHHKGFWALGAQLVVVTPPLHDGQTQMKLKCRGRDCLRLLDASIPVALSHPTPR